MRNRKRKDETSEECENGGISRMFFFFFSLITTSFSTFPARTLLGAGVVVSVVEVVGLVSSVDSFCIS